MKASKVKNLKEIARKANSIKTKGYRDFTTPTKMDIKQFILPGQRKN